MSDPVHSMRFAVVDTETTGLFPATDRVLQIGVVIVAEMASGTSLPPTSSDLSLNRLGPSHGITRVDRPVACHLRSPAQLQELLHGAILPRIMRL